MRTRGAAVMSLAGWSGLAATAVLVLRTSVVVPDGQPVSLAFELLRRVALGAAWYVLALTCAGALARGLRAVSLVRALDAVTIAPLRHTIRAALGVGLAGALAVSGPAIAMAAPDDPPIVTLHRLSPSPTPTTTTTTTVVAPPPATPPLTWAVDRPAPPAPPVAVHTASPPSRPEISPGASVWQVRPGDCFWTIAESVLVTRLGRPVAEREIVPYWQRVIAANRARLPDTDNPDLIFPGQSFVLPG